MSIYFSLNEMPHKLRLLTIYCLVTNQWLHTDYKWQLLTKNMLNYMEFTEYHVYVCMYIVVRTLSVNFYHIVVWLNFDDSVVKSK